MNVNGIANVKAEDRNKFEELIQNTKFFNGINPDSKKLEENQKLIKELRKYLISLEQKLNKYNGIANIPSRKTNNDTIVLKEDEFEYNTILKIISLLESSNSKLVGVWNIGFVSYDKVPKFKKLLNATKYFGDSIPTITENDEEIKKIKLELAEMISKAKNTENAVLASNGLVLDSDLERYKLLEEKYKYLEAAKASDDLVEINGVKIDGKYVARYQEINNRLLNLASLPEKDETKSVPVSSTLIEKPENKDDLSNSSTNLVAEINPNNPKDTHEDSVSKTSSINALVNPRKKVVSVRKIGGNAKEHIKKYWKVYLACGLCIAIVTLVLSELAPIIIYANSCNALAMPWASGFFNGLSSAIAKLGGIQFLNGAWLTQSGSIINLGAVASKSLLATLQAMGALGLIGASFVATNKVVKNLMKEDKGNKLISPKEKQNALDKIHSVIANISGKFKEFGNNLMKNADLKNIELNNNLVNAKIARESIQDTLLNEEVDSSTIEQISEEEVKSKQRIEERLAKINSERETKYEDVYITPHIKDLSGEIVKSDLSVQEKPVITIPSDEEILDSISDKKLVLAQTDNYIDALKNGENAKVYRDLVLKNTGIDLDEYDMNNYEELVRARSDVAAAMNDSVEAIIKRFENRAIFVQDLIDVSNGLDKIKYETELNLINSALDGLKKLERGIK